MPTLTTRDGTRIFYRVRGKGRPALLFVHGWCSRLEHWDAQVRHFARRHRVLALDRRGHGRSDAPPGGYTLEQHAADLAEVAGKERLRGAVLIAHAGGGPAALELARSHPEIVRALVLVDARIGSAARLDDPEDPAGAAFRAMLDRLVGSDAAHALRAIYAGFFSAHAGRAGTKALAEALETPLAVAAAELRSLAGDTEAIARQVTQPVLWISVAAADQSALASVFRNVHFGQVVGSGHFPQIEVPDQIDAMIGRFVTTLQAARKLRRDLRFVP